MPITHVKGWAIAKRTDILAEVDAIIRQAPVYHAGVGTSGRLRYEMTNCGKYGWWSTEGYTRINPITNQPWPRVTINILAMMTDAAKRVYPQFRLESVLINVYDIKLNQPNKEILGFHQDTSERNREAPIISVSFGKGTFLVGGKVNAEGRLSADDLRRVNRTMPTRFDVDDGDLIVMYGPERMCFHAAGEVRPNEELGDRRINLTGRMVDPVAIEDKPLIISFVGLSSLEQLSEQVTQEIDNALVYRKTTERKLPSEILIGNQPGFDRLAAAYVKQKKYPTAFIYEMGYEDAPKTGYPLRHVGDDPAPLYEILEQGDYLLAVTNGTDERVQGAIAYYQNLEKSPWIVTVEDIENDPADPDPEPPAIPTPPSQPGSEEDPENRENGIGTFFVTNKNYLDSLGPEQRWTNKSIWHLDDWSRVYCGRGGPHPKLARSPLANPFKIGTKNPQTGQTITRDDAILSFRTRVLKPAVDGADPFDPRYAMLLEIAKRLASGKNVELICHCAPQPCHATNIGRAAIWMIEQGRIPVNVEIPNRLQVGMVGLTNLVGLTPRMELEIKSLLVNKHREWYLKLNGVPSRNPIVHIRDSTPNPGGPDGFDKLVRTLLIQKGYPDVVVHGSNPTLPPDLPWKASSEDLLKNLDYLFALWDDEDPEIGSLLSQVGNRALIAYKRKPKVNLPDPIPEIDDPQRFAKYAEVVVPGSYVAVVGSREFKSAKWGKEAIAQFVNALPPDCILVSGGAKGADTYAQEAAEARGLKTLIHEARWVQRPSGKPDWKPKLHPEDRLVEDSNERANAGTERNKVVVEESNCLYAFVSAKGESKGTTDAINYAALKYKCAPDMVFKEGEEKRKLLPSSKAPFQLFFFDED